MRKAGEIRSSTGRGARIYLLRRLSLAALCLGLTVPAATSAAERFVYVSHSGPPFFAAGTNNVSALRINANGSLTPVAGSPFATGGAVVEGLALTPDARRLYVAGFGNAMITTRVLGFNVNANGGLSPVAGSPFTGGYTNVLGVAPDSNGGHLFGWNHGSAIAVSRINANGSLTNIAGSPFALPATQLNPFAGSVAPDGDHLYVPHENATETVAGCGGTCEVNRVGVYSVAANGAVASIQGAGAITGTTNVNPGGPNPFGSTITPDGRFVYVSNPEDGANGTITGFRVNANGTLTAIAGLQALNVSPGNHPLAMVVSPDGRHLYVAARALNTVNGYAINQTTGALTPHAAPTYPTGGTNGKSLALTPDGKRLYVSNEGSNNVSGFNRAANGTLTLIPSSPWATGGTSPDLESIVITPNQAPQASFVTVFGPQTSFNASSSSDTDGGSVARYDWDFGDGTTLPDGGPSPQHFYAQPGTYVATLTVTDDEGCSTQRIFTGKATLCNGSQSARTTLAVEVLACRGMAVTLAGTSGDDTLLGTPGADVIAGLDGNDTIKGLAGNDVICGGNGKDKLVGGKGKDRLFGENGKDRLVGGKGKDKLFGGKGKDRLLGGKGKDKLVGGKGKDVLKGGPGKDKLRGGPGKDVQKQ